MADRLNYKKLNRLGNVKVTNKDRSGKDKATNDKDNKKNYIDQCSDISDDDMELIENVDFLKAVVEGQDKKIMQTMISNSIGTDTSGSKNNLSVQCFRIMNFGDGPEPMPAMLDGTSLSQ